jgi:putative ABC transport system permease protein
MQGSRAQLHDTLKRHARGATRQRLRGLLVVSEVAVALVLLAGAGLLMRSFLGLVAVSPGFDPRHALTVRVNLDDSPDARARPADFVETATARLAALPGVRAVAASARFPFAESPLILPFTILGRPELTDAERPMSNHYQVSPEYFRAMGIPLVRGRAFERTDRDGTARVAMISASLAARFFPGEDPIGKSLQIYGPPCQIVGVVGDVRIDPASPQPGFQTYQPLAQWSWTKVNFVLRTSGAPERQEAAVRAAIAGLDRRIPMYSVRNFDALVAESIARQRLAMILFAVFSGLALLLAAVGIYGVMAYAVAQRRSEIGVRMALGAQAGNVVGLVFAQAARLLGLGLLLGLLGALALTRFLERLLYEVSARDPLTFLGMVGLLAATGAVACLLPARRAARLDPMVALRAE